MEKTINSELEKWFRERQVSINIRDFNKPKTFNGLQDFTSFIQSEVDYWEKLANLHQYAKEVRDYFSRVLNNINLAINNADSGNVSNAYGQLNEAINSATTSNWQTTLYSLSPLSKMLVKHLKENALTANPIFEYARNGNGHVNGKEVPYWVGMIDFVLSTSSGTKNLMNKSVETEKQALADIRDTYLEDQKKLNGDYEERSKEIFNEVERFKSGLTSWENSKTTSVEEFLKKNEEDLEEVKTRYEKEFEEMKDRYEKHISLKAPAEYWRDLKRSYFKQANIWLIVTTILTIGFIFYLQSALNDISKWVVIVTDKNTMIQNVKGALIFALIVSAAAFLIRLFIRLSISAFHLSRDAHERLQLTTVYLALLKETGAVNDAERSIVLQSIFSRADTGLLKGDSSPAMPSPAETLFAQVTKAKTPGS